MTTTFSVGASTYVVDQKPGNCPICHHAIDGRHLSGVELRSTGSRPDIELVFQCPRPECGRTFIARYVAGEARAQKLKAIEPFTPQAPTHPPEVAKLSPQFAEIYRQAAVAEGFNLGEISGCGYRKALEFLVKDYCIAEDPAQAETIKGKLLGRVIADHISDLNIKECAKRAAWLGNDETHYVRTWTTKDVKDLKALIALTESWINANLLTKKYLAEMN